MRKFHKQTRQRLWFVLIFAFAALSQQGVAFAQKAESPVIVLVADRADANITQVLRGELMALGLRVTVAARGEHEIAPRELTEVARRHHAMAAFRVLVEEGQVEVWLADRITGKVLLREVLVTQKKDPSQTDENNIVARAVELLRASLLELDVNARSGAQGVERVQLPPKLLPAKANPSAVAQPAVGRLSTTTSVALLGASAHAALSAAVGLALQGDFAAGFGAVGRLTLPLTGPSYVAPQGRAEVRPRWISVGLRVHTNAPTSRWQGSLESGWGLLLVDAVGFAGAGYSARSTLDTDPFLYLGPGVRYSLSGAVAASLACWGGVGLRPSQIIFDQQLIDQYGKWVMLSQLGLDLSWP